MKMAGEHIGSPLQTPANLSWLLCCRFFKRSVEAAYFARVAGWPGGINQDEQGVAVAVHANLADALDVAAGRALVPEFAAASAPKDGLAHVHRLFERLGV